MKKQFKILISLLAITLISCENESKDEITLEDKMKVSYLGKLDDKMSKSEITKMYDLAFKSPEKYGFIRVKKDPKYDLYIKENYKVFVRNLPNEKEENIIMSDERNISKTSSKTTTINYGKFYIRSYDCMCLGLASLNDPTENTVDDECQIIDAGIYNYSEMQSYVAYNNTGISRNGDPHWVASQYAEFTNAGGSQSWIVKAIEDLPDGWISFR